MKRAALALLLVGCASRTSDPQTYANNDAQLVVGNAARMTCSCKFVMQMDDDFCAAWVKASPNIAKYTVDLDAKTVEATTLLQFSAKARFVDERRGCLLE